MSMLYQLPNQDQHRFVHACNNCMKHLETRYHCTVCNDFELCITCFEKDGHPHKMEKLHFGLDSVSVTSDQKAVYCQETSCRRIAIERCIQSMVHACQCHDANCQLPRCRKLKRVFQHAKNCKRKTNGGCPICKQLIALCCYHAKHCQERKCPVSFCLTIKLKFLKREFQEHSQEAQILKTITRSMRNIHISETVPQQSPSTSTSTNHLSSSPRPHTLPHTSQLGIGMKSATGSPAGALQIIQQVQDAAPMVIARNYEKDPLIGQSVQGNPDIILAQRQIQPQMQKPIPIIMSGVLNPVLQSVGGLEESPWARQDLQVQPHQMQQLPPPQQTMGLQQMFQHMSLNMPNAMKNPVSPMSLPQELSNAEPGSSFTQSNQAFHQLLQALKSPASQQQQQQVITILKSNPDLVTTFIKQRSQRQQQQMSLNMPNAMSSPVAPNGSFLYGMF